MIIKIFFLIIPFYSKFLYISKLFNQYSKNINIIIFLLIGAVSGWLAGRLWKGGGFGLIGNIIIGVVGGFFGGWLAGQLGIGGGGLLYQILISVAGAWLLLFIISFFKKK